MAETKPKPQSQPFKKKLTITSQRELATFKRESEDSPTVIYEVFAVNEQGKEIDKLLRTFQPELPIGELIEFEVKEYVHPDYGQTFTLKMPSRGHASKKDISDLRKQVRGLADRISAIEEALSDLQAKMAKEEELDERFGTDPPF